MNATKYELEEEVELCVGDEEEKANNTKPSLYQILLNAKLRALKNLTICRKKTDPNYNFGNQTSAVKVERAKLIGYTDFDGENHYWVKLEEESKYEGVF